MFNHENYSEKLAIAANQNIEERDYWLKKLSGELIKSCFPYDYRKEEIQKPQLKKIKIRIDDELFAKLKRLSSGSDFRLHMVLVAGMNVLLSKYTGNTDIIVGTPIYKQDFEGEFINTVVALRNRVEGNLTFKDLLLQVRETLREALENYRYPLSFLIEKLEIPVTGGEFPLFGIAVLLENLHDREYIRHLDLDMIFSFSGTDRGMEGEVEYNSLLYTEATVGGIIEHFTNLLHRLLTDTDAVLTHIDVVGEEEKRRLLEGFNGMEVGYPRDKTLQRLFEEQVERTPDYIALAAPRLPKTARKLPTVRSSAQVAGADGSNPLQANFPEAIDEVVSITYKELNEKSNRLAWVLIEKGVGPDTIVGILVNRTLEMIIGLLGILKAGGAYLPIEPGIPYNRLLSILEDTQTPVLLTETGEVDTYSFTALQGLQFIKIPPHITKARAQIQDFTGLPFPDRSLISYEKYNRYIGLAMVKNTISLQGTRGCPYNCAYCHKIWPRHHVIRTAENIFEEIKLYYNMGIRRFVIIDDIFNFNRENSTKLFRLIIDQGLDVKLFFPNGVRGDILTRDYIDLMVQAGTTAIALALETASPRLQELIRKNLHLDKLRENLEYFCDRYPQVILELFTMHGFPTETEEEALMTLDFIKQLKWLHFPYVHILKIYPNTDMEKLALEHGITREAIARSANLAYHELPETLPFEKSFSLRFQTEFLNEYFLSKERLLKVLPHQVKVLTENEIVQKYDSYLSARIDSFDDILQLTGITAAELGTKEFLAEERIAVPQLDEKIANAFPKEKSNDDALRVLFLELSQFFSHESEMLYDVIEPPLGLMYVMTYLHRQLGGKIKGKIAKSRIDFDNYDQLKLLLEEFKPDVIGIRTLTFYKNFFHKAVTKIREWGIHVPVIAGGPYATSDYKTILQDRNVDLVVLGEGEITTCELIRKIMDNEGKLPREEVLREIPGIAFIPRSRALASSANLAREVFLVDGEILTDPGDGKRTPNPGLRSRPGHLAYIIFTSGSSGKPKGAMIEQKNVVRLLNNEKFQFDFNSRDVWTMYHSYAFDFSVWEMYGALLYGGKLMVIPKMVARDFTRFTGILEKEAVTVLNQTPSAFYQLSEEAEARPGKKLNLRTIIFGGEALNPAKLKPWHEMYPAVRLINMYGITETTVHVTYKEIEAGDTRTARSKIGAPIPTLSMYVMDRDMRLLPMGVPGELCVGGEGVCRGYLNRPELTKEKFVRNPYKPAERLYRSGDLARYIDPAGDMEYLGRIDHQVKIRGFRIELGEIRSVLVKYEKLKDAAAMVRDHREISEPGDKTEGKYLCAYLVPDGELSLPGLRAYLSRELPDYMIPAQFVILEKIPLTPNGKVDMKNLPSPRGIALESGAEHAAPKSKIEETLVEIWQKALGRDSIGIDDSFFLVGGDSITAIQVVSRMKKFGYKIEIKDIFQYPTIAELAPKVTILEEVAADQSVVTGTIPLTPIQKFFFDFPGSKGAKIGESHYNQALMFYSPGGFPEEAVKAALKKIQQHHDALRITYKKENGTIIQTNHGLDYPLSMEVHDFRQHPDRASGKDLLERYAGEIQRSIDLESGPLMKVGLFRLEDGDRLLIVVHHLVIDGVSWRILFEDLETLIRQYQDGEPLALPLKSNSFKEWAEKLNEYANTGVFLKTAAYWRELESSAMTSPLPGIPKDFAQEDNRVKDTQSLSVRLDKTETTRLLEKVHHAYGTEINDILLTALGLAVKKTWGVDRIVIALEGHGREDLFPGVDIGRTIGWFTSLYPVVLDFSYTGTLSRQIKEVKETLRRIPGSGIGYGILKYLTAPGNKEKVSFNINPQLSFNYLGQFDADVAQTSLTIARESAGNLFNPGMQRQFDLEMNGLVAGNCLTMTLIYNRKHYEAKTLQTLMDHYKAALEEVVSHCSRQTGRERTPSDFTYKELSIEALEQLSTRYDLEDIYLLTPMQEGMLFHTLYQDNTGEKTRGAYFEQLSYRLRGRLQPDLVEKSVNELIRRYDVLRTAFVYEGTDRPLQIVLRERQVEFSYVDLRHPGPGDGRDKNSFIKEFKIKDRQRSFDLSEDVLMRVALVQTGEEEYEFIWSHHHILMDGWCVGILISDYSEIYSSYLEQRACRLSPVKPYRSYLQWLARQDKEASRQYWQRYLDSYDEAAGIFKGGWGKPPAEEEPYRHAEVSFTLEKDTLHRLQQLTARNHITVNTLVQTVWGIILGKNNDKEDVVFGAVVSGRPSEIEGVEAMVGLFIDTVPVRIRYDRETPAGQLLKTIQEKAIESEKHHYFPLVEIQANSILKQNLLDHIMIFENYPLADEIDGLTRGDQDEKPGRSQLELSGTEAIEHTNYDLNIAIYTKDLFFQVTFNYNGRVYEKETLERTAGHFKHVVQQILDNETIAIGEITLLTREEKAQLLFAFNDTRIDYPGDKTISRLFAEQVSKKPGHTALGWHLDLSRLHDHLESQELNIDLLQDYEKCCFKKNPYIFQFKDRHILEAIEIFNEKQLEDMVLLRTHQENYVVVDRRLHLLLEELDGRINLETLAKMIGKTKENLEFLVYQQTTGENNRTKYIINGKEGDREILKSIVTLVKVLYRTYLIYLADYKAGTAEKEMRFLQVKGEGRKEAPGEPGEPGGEEGETAPAVIRTEAPGEEPGRSIKSPVLLLGDTPGAATTGLLYLASFLRRKGITAYCQWYDQTGTTASLKKNVEELLTRVKPRLVGISMKWFPHIARVLEIGKIVKEYDAAIEVVVGGNTASYYRQEVIKFDWIDYVVCGDGEIPLLKICRGEEEIPNCVYKKDGKIIQTPMSYVQDETNSAEFYFSRLEEVLVSRKEIYQAPFLYINTGKGCSQRCFYCGGCSEAQLATYNRAKPFLRGVEEVRKDIVEAKKFTSTFLFDFDLPLYHSLDYYRQIWGGIDLSDYFCIFYFWKLPAPEFIDLVVKTFKYVRMDIDLCSLSERHRRELTTLGVVKPQPTDAEIFSFFERCDRYDNVKVVINHIAGLPYFDARDIEKSSETISQLLLKYSSLHHMDWGRLHAQPGAPLMEQCETYNMHSYASSFQDFLRYSRLNLEEDRYPGLDTFHYPYIYFDDEELNSRVSNHYYEANQRLEKNRAENRRGLGIDYKVTYRQLEEISDRLAAWLKQRGSRPGMIVALLMERSIEMVAAILGILEAGGAYLPVDPEYPRERIAYMLKDSRAAILITRGNSIKIAPELQFQGEVIELTSWDDVTWPFHEQGKEDPREQGTQSREKPRFMESDRESRPGDLAYIIYTSGSTGKPKGVMVNQGNVVRLVKGSNYIEYREEDRLLLTGSMVFDITTFEIWGPLLNGIGLYLAEQTLIMDADRLGKRLMKDKITILHLIPQLFNQLAARRMEIFAGLRYLLVGGDMVTPRYINEARKKYPHLQIRHMYGPTENTTFSTYFPVKQDYETHIPIGKPVGHSTVYILGRDGNLQPIGAVGELWVGGAGVARGYLNRPELTAEKFLSMSDRSDRSDSSDCSDMSNKSNVLYRTGDLGRWMPDPAARGAYIIEFLGRIDTQVKLRGFRIELGEIESQLLKHPHIREAVVTLKGMTPFAQPGTDQGYICAYIIPAGGYTASVTELREYLSARLPNYMVPSYFVRLETFPLTPNGKVDIRALPEPKENALSSGVKYLAPRNIVEKTLVRIWESVLGKSQISIDENFFMVGGDSIKAIQVSSRLMKAGYKAEIRDILKKPSISELAPFIKKTDRSADQSPVTGIVPLTPVQEGFFAHPGRTFHHNNQAVMFYSKEIIEEEAIKAVFGKLQAHHDAFRMTYKEENGRTIQIAHGLEYPFSLQTYDFRCRGDAVEAFENRINEIQSGINLETGPLMKLGLFHLDDGDRLLIVVHHLVIDGVSWRILFEDIGSLFQQYKQGENLELPLKTDSFKIWAEKLREYSNSEAFLKGKSYWKKLVSAEIPGINKDFQEGTNYIKDTRTLSFTLGELETARLLEKVNKAFATEINDILLTAFGIGIKNTFEQQRVLIALEGHGREEILKEVDISRTIGWFTSLYPVLLDFSFESDLARQIKEIKETLHRIPGKGIDYGILKYLTAAEYKQDMELHFKPQINFNYLGQFDTDLQQISLGIARETVGNTQNPDESREYELQVSGMITAKRLVMSISYNEKQYKAKTIETLLEHIKINLGNIISYCSAREERDLTPVDLTYSQLSIDTLDRLQKQYPLEDIYPLTPMQEGMLFYALYSTNTSTYFAQMSHRLRGDLKVDFVQKSINELFKRYDILRTIFIHKGLDRPLQLVLKNRQVDFCYEDISEMAGEKDAKEAYIKKFKETDRQRSFDLSRDVLMRAAVFRVDKMEYEFIWSHHHIIMEGWCFGILMTEYNEIYNSYLEAREYRLPVVKPYRMYIQWLEQQDKEFSKRYWANYLENYKELAGIPESRVHKTAKKEYINEDSAFTLGEEETGSLNNLAMQNRATLNTVMQVIWAIILANYNPRPGGDVVFGAVVSGRPSQIEDVESIVGLFINTVPVRIRCEAKTKVNQLVRQVQEEAADSEPHQYCSIADIQSGSVLKQNLLNHILVFENYLTAERGSEVAPTEPGNEGNTGSGKGLTMANAEGFEQSSYNFNLVIVPGKQLKINFKYNRSVYNRGLLEILELNFKQVAAQIANNPGIEIDKITITKDVYPTSTARQRLYNLLEMGNQWEDGNIYTLWLLQGRLEVKKAGQLFYKLINRHERLRTSFGLVGDKLFQQCHRSVEFFPEYFETKEEKLRGILKDFCTPFDLTRAPLLKIGVIKTSADKYLVVVNTHQLVSDMTFHNTLLEEFTVLYNGETLPPLAAGYPSYWENRDNRQETHSIISQGIDGQGEFSPDTPVQTFPTDYPRSGIQKGEADAVAYELSPEETKALKRMAGDAKTSSDIVLLAIYNILLSKITGWKDIVIGVLSENWPSNQAERLPLQNYPLEEKTFAAFLAEVNEKARDTFNHREDSPGDQVRQPKENRKPAGNPIFTILFDYRKEVLVGNKQEGAIQVTKMNINTFKKSISTFDFDFSVFETENNINIDFQYNPTLFKNDTITRFAGYVKDIVFTVTRDNHTKLKDISISHHLLTAKYEIPESDFGF